MNETPKAPSDLWSWRPWLAALATAAFGTMACIAMVLIVESLDNGPDDLAAVVFSVPMALVLGLIILFSPIGWLAVIVLTPTSRFIAFGLARIGWARPWTFAAAGAVVTSLFAPMLIDGSKSLLDLNLGTTLIATVLSGALTGLLMYALTGSSRRAKRTSAA